VLLDRVTAAHSVYRSLAKVELLIFSLRPDNWRGGATLGCCTDKLRCQHLGTDSVLGLYRKRQTVSLAATVTTNLPTAGEGTPVAKLGFGREKIFITGQSQLIELSRGRRHSLRLTGGAIVGSGGDAAAQGQLLAPFEAGAYFAQREQHTRPAMPQHKAFVFNYPSFQTFLLLVRNLFS